MALKGTHLTQESKEKLRLSHLGKKHSQKTKDAISLAHTGKKHSQKTKDAIGLANRGRKHTKEARKNMSLAHKGHPVSEETRDKMSKSMKGRKHTKEARKNMSLAAMGHKPTHKKNCKCSFCDRRGIKVSEETRAKLSLARKNRIITKECGNNISKALKGRKIYWADKIALANTGKKPTKETRDKMSLAHLKIWSGYSAEERSTRISKCMSLMTVGPNKKEKKLFWIVDTLYPKEYKLNVKGKTVLNGFVPDIVNVNGQKKCMELFGDYWHKKPDLVKRDKRRKIAYNELGWRCLVVWEKELKKPVKLITKIREFCKV